MGEINSSNTVDAWNFISAVLPHGNCCNRAISFNNSLYLTGGHNGLNYYPDLLRLDLLSGLHVPNIKQYSLRWKDLEYDTASLWSPGKENIDRWGCALTSAAMILSYYGHSINPNVLNLWLKTNNGFIGDGLVDWSAVTRYAKLSHDINPELPKLEYKRYSFETAPLDAELNLARPAVIKLVRPSDHGTHFVVATGKVNSTYFMNDPATSQTLLSYYPTDQYNRIDSFVPSNTDLSYLYLYLSSNASFTIYQPDGTLSTEGLDMESPLIDQVDQSLGPQKTLKTFTLPKPASGEYIVRITGDGAYKLSSRIYDVDANLKESNWTDSIQNNQKDTYMIAVGTTQEPQKIDFNFLRQNIKTAYQEGKIKNGALYNSLLVMVNNAEALYLKGKVTPAKQLLDSMASTLKVSKKLIDPSYSMSILANITYVKESL